MLDTPAKVLKKDWQNTMLEQISLQKEIVLTN